MLPLSALPIRLWSQISLAVLASLGAIINVAAVIVTYTRYFYADLAGVRPGIWPQIYLWKTSVAVIGNAIVGRIPSGRITGVAARGPTAILKESASLNSPDFWWFY